MSTTKEVWNLARELARSCRAAGKTIPSVDLAITACALYHNAELEHCDEHIDIILKTYFSKK